MINIYRNIGELLTLKGASKKQARHIEERDLSVVKKAAMVSSKGEILWVGKENSLTPSKLKALLAASAANKSAIKDYDLDGRVVMPSFVESHTHLVFAGDRSAEFEQRNRGVSYQQIAEQGGGILSTVKATRRAKEEQLLSLAQQRVNRFVAQGVTTVEIKSGYALDRGGELKMLRVAQQLKKVRKVVTYLGAHAIPAEFSGADDYLEFVIKKMLPVIAEKQLADRVDIFIEKGYFSPSHGRQLFTAAKSLGLGVCAHVDQLNRTGGAVVAATAGADSVDHLIQLNSGDIGKLAKSQSTCVLLPGADFYLKMAYPPARKLIDAGARVALATDFNPGSCPTQDLSLMGVLARLEMKMTLAEVISAYTLGAAHALSLHNKVGSLESGKSCDFVELSDDWRNLFYQVGYHPVFRVWKAGKPVFHKKL